LRTDLIHFLGKIRVVIGIQCAVQVVLIAGLVEFGAVGNEVLQIDIGFDLVVERRA